MTGQSQSTRIGQRAGADAHPRILFCTALTMPQAPWDGMLVYREDSSTFQVYNQVEAGWLDPFTGSTGNQTYVGPDNPYTPETRIGDLWIRTPDNILFRWSGDQWLSYDDPRILSKNQTFDSPSTQTPTANAVGDLWWVRDLGLYRRWNGTTWANHNPNASTLVGGTIPDAVLDGTQIQRDAEKAILDAANAGTKAEDASAEAAAAIIAAATAHDIGQQALDDAATAIETANGKADVTTSESAPIAPAINDLWMVPSLGNKMFTWTGTQWAVTTAATAPNSITAVEVADFAIPVNKLRSLTHMIY